MAASLATIVTNLPSLQVHENYATLTVGLADSGGTEARFRICAGAIAQPEGWSDAGLDLDAKEASLVAWWGLYWPPRSGSAVKAQWLRRGIGEAVRSLTRQTVCAIQCGTWRPSRCMSTLVNEPISITPRS